MSGPAADQRLLDVLAADADQAIVAIRAARAAARRRVWGHRSPLADGPVIVDLDATLIGAHSEKELASPNFKRGFGFHPMMAFVDHGAGGTGEPLAAMLRPGRANANEADDQIAVLDAALAQLPADVRSRVLVRGDSGSGVKALLAHIDGLGLQYSVGMAARHPVLDALAALPRQAWKKALDADGRPRDGARVAELTGWLPATFTGWPPGMRVIARKERPHPGAQLPITDHEGWRITVFATNTVGGRLADLEVDTGSAAEDRIRDLKDTGATNLPLQAFDKNQIWLELSCLASELISWTQSLAWHDAPARLWGTQTAPATTVRGRRPDHHHRPAPHPAALEAMALNQPDPHRTPPARRSPLTATTRPYNQRKARSAGENATPGSSHAQTPSTRQRPITGSRHSPKKDRG